jgi:hypothetical protein
VVEVGERHGTRRECMGQHNDGNRKSVAIGAVLRPPPPPRTKTRERVGCCGGHRCMEVYNPPQPLPPQLLRPFLTRGWRT